MELDHTPEPNLIKLWYLGQIEECKEYMALDRAWISELNRIREKYPDNWKIVEACRELIFHHIKDAKEGMDEITRLKRSADQLS